MVLRNLYPAEDVIRMEQTTDKLMERRWKEYNQMEA
jgi:hypothetical protein